MPQKEHDSSWIGAIFFFLPFIIGIPYYFYKKHLADLQSPYSFDVNKKLNKDNLLNAYICLSALLIKSDPREAREKISYLNKYFKSHFPSEHLGFREVLNDAYQEDIDFNQLINWLKAKLPAHKDRVQIIYFLVGLAFIDGAINRKELKVMSNLADLLNVTPKEFESILGMYQSYERNSQKAKQASVPAENKLKLSAQILGVSEHASMDEIKKAYRKLAKLHHPDKFYNNSPEQQKIAQEKFLMIQKAYELLEIIKKTT